MRFKVLKISLIIAFNAFFTSLNLATANVDSLINLLKTSPDPQKLRIYANIHKEYIKTDIKKSLIYTLQGLELARKLNDSTAIGDFLNQTARVYQFSGSNDTALAYYDSALTVYRAAHNTSGVAAALSNIGVLYRKLGKFEIAIDYQIQSLKIKESINDSSGMAYSYHNLGSIYYNLEEYSKAIDYFTRALNINQKLESKVDIASNHNNLGSAYLELKEYSKALWHFNQAYGLFISTGHERYAAICADNIGCIYEDQGKYQQAIEAHNKAMAIHDMFQDVQSQCNCYYNLGRAYAGLRDFNLSESMYLKGLSMASKVSNAELIYEINFSLHELYLKKGDFKHALERYKTYTSIKDSIFNEQKQLQITEIETKYESEKKEQQIILQSYQIASQSAELRQEQYKRYGLILILILFIGLVIVILKAYNDKQETNKILADKNKNITESITYARKIQQAVLPPEERIKNLIPEHFILYKPRDIVSGDFFWIAEKNGRTIVAVADCTGHGVPGAFMSMLGVAFLNEIVNRNQELQANLILNELRDRIKESLNQSGRENEAQDGIDIALCVIDKDKKALQYAGAYSPLYIIKNDELIRYKADLMPIGYQIKEKPSFTNNNIQLDKGDIIYLFSDGYSDQLGGEECIRLKTEPFKKMLFDIHQMPLPEQKGVLEKNLNEWKGEHPQIDDILVMGFKIT